jgi:hypothetical protein
MDGTGYAAANKTVNRTNSKTDETARLASYMLALI